MTRSPGQPDVPDPDTPDSNPPNSDAPPPEPPAPPAGSIYRMGWSLYLILAVAAVIWLGLREGSVSLRLFLEPATWWKDLALGLGAGVGLLAVWEAARWRLSVARELEQQLGQVLGGLDPQEAMALAVLSGFAEEIFFRGAVLGAFSTAGWLWSSLLFALLHSGPGRALRFWSLFAFAAGLAFAGLAVWRGNLLAPVVAHVTVNAVNLRRMAAAAGAGDQGGNGAAANR